MQHSGQERGSLRSQGAAARAHGHRCPEFGVRGKQQPGNCLPCSSQHALGLKWCRWGCEHRCQHGMGPLQWTQRDSISCAQPLALWKPFRSASSALWTINIVQQADGSRGGEVGSHFCPPDSSGEKDAGAQSSATVVGTPQVPVLVGVL